MGASVAIVTRDCVAVVHAAEFGVAGVGRANLIVVTEFCRFCHADTCAALASIGVRAGVAVIADLAAGGVNAAFGSVATIQCANVFVVAVDCRTATIAALASVILRAQTPVVTGFAVAYVAQRANACFRFANCAGTLVGVWTGLERSADATGIFAQVALGTGISVGARRAVVIGGGATAGGQAGIDGARVGVVANFCLTCQTLAIRAHVAFRAGVAVRITGAGRVGVHAKRYLAIATIDCASISVIAGPFIDLAVAVVVFAVAGFTHTRGCRARRQTAVVTNTCAFALANLVARRIFDIDRTHRAQLLSAGEFAAKTLADGAFGVHGCALFERLAVRGFAVLARKTFRAICIGFAASTAKFAVGASVHANRTLNA